MKGSTIPKKKKITQTPPQYKSIIHAKKSTDTRIHCVPIDGCFEDEMLPEYGFLAMPSFRWFNRPALVSIDAVLESIGKTLEAPTARLSIP